MRRRKSKRESGFRDVGDLGIIPLSQRVVYQD